MKKRVEIFAGHESMRKMLPAERETPEINPFESMLSRGTRMLGR